MHNDKLRNQDIIRAIRDIPEAEPPHGFAASVMHGLEPKRPSLWIRLKLWLTAPRSVTFTPARLIPAMAVAALLLVFAYAELNHTVLSGPQLSVVRFVLDDSARQARSVAVIGSFNDWQAEGAAMHYDAGAKAWVLEAELPPGDHEYMFMVDGRKLMADPHASMYRDDGFGNRNSILFVNGGHEQTL